jgi:hypothetical protein
MSCKALPIFELLRREFSLESSLQRDDPQVTLPAVVAR